jgi:dienelactone hydrolase
VASTLADEFVAAAGIHPGPLATDAPDSPHHELAGVRGELYFAFAETDQRVPPEMVDTFRDELARHGVAGVVEIAPGTHHGFAMADLSVYEPQAAERHFERTLDLWRRTSPGSRRVALSAGPTQQQPPPICDGEVIGRPRDPSSTAARIPTRPAV